MASMTMTTTTGEQTEDPTKLISSEESSVEEFAELKGQVDEFIQATGDARALSERCRDYKDGKQWTEAQIKELRRRKQAPTVNNRIKVKHMGLLGLTSLRKGDPKAYPRNVDADSGAAEAVTDGLRYAADKTKLNSKFMRVADNFFCEGYGGVHVTVEQTPRGDVEVLVESIPWDRIYFDPYSAEPDFSDARIKGFVVWMDEEDIRNTFEDLDTAVLSTTELMTDETFEDRPSWFRTFGKRRRHLVATHYFMRRDKWYVAIFTGSGFLVPPMESPWLDEYGVPECPIELVSAYVDRENNRRGELADFLDLQDEINHRRSKALFLLSQRQTFGNRGAVKDIKKAKRELAKPDGHLEIGMGELNKDFGILPTNDMAQGQLEMYNDAKQEIDAQSFNAQLAGERQSGDLSGVAIGRLQKAGVLELNMLFDSLTEFKLAVYRQMWNRIRQFWDREKWVRVTDDEKSLRWVGFNVPLPMKQALEDIMKDETNPYELRIGASAQLIQLEQQNPQALEQIIEVKNKPAELDMDIILEESYDVINASEEQLDAILKFGAQGQFDIIDLLEISNIQGKERLIDKLNGRRAEAAKTAGQDPQSQLFMATAAREAASAEEKKASALNKQADANQTNLETQLLQQHGVPPFKGSVSA